MSDGSQLEQLRARRDELADWLARASAEVRNLAADDARRRTFAEIKDRHTGIVQQIEELERQQRQGSMPAPSGWSPGFLAWMEAGAMRDDLLLNPPSGDSEQLHRYAVELLANGIEGWTKGEVKASTCRSVIPGDAGLILWFGNALSRYWDFLRQKQTEADAAKTLLGALREWYRVVAKREWEGWQPPGAGGIEGTDCPRGSDEEAAGGAEAGAEGAEDDDVRIPGLPQRLRDLARRCLPCPLPQPTMQEARAMGQAVSPAGRSAGWLTDQFGEEYRFKPDRDMTAVLDIRALRALDARNETLACVLASLGADATRLALACVGLVRETGGAFRGVPIDALIGLLGWSPNTMGELVQMRSLAWRWLQVFSNLRVWGARRGYYTQPGTRERIETISRDALIVILGEEVNRNDPSNPVPVSVTIQPGPWYQTVLGNAKALPFFGNLHDSTPVPPDEPSGALARNVELALNQLWRQDATKPGVYAFTREKLLRLFGGDAILRPILEGRDPRRARAYWDRAMDRLKQMGVIGYYAEVDTGPLPRKGWRDVWLRQRLEIQPGPEGRQALETMAASGEKRAAALSARGAGTVRE